MHALTEQSGHYESGALVGEKKPAELLDVAAFPVDGPQLMVWKMFLKAFPLLHLLILLRGESRNADVDNMGVDVGVSEFMDVEVPFGTVLLLDLIVYHLEDGLLQ